MLPEPNRKTRVLLLGPELGAISGVSTHLNQIFGSGLAMDFELEHFTVGSEGRHETPLSKLIRLVFSPVALAARIIAHRPDIVHINTSLDHRSFPRDAVYLVVARVLRRKTVFQVHGGAFPQDLYRSGFLRDQFVRRVLTSASVVVLLATSELAAYSRFVPQADLRVIANGMSVSPQLMAARGVRSGPLRLTYLGRLVATKGVADCIEAARLLVASGRDVTLRIAGGGPQEAALRAKAAELVDNGAVEFVGPKFGADKDRLWCETDVFVFPTSHAEGLPYALLESMAAGAVPITTRAGAAPDVIEAGVHGLFVPAADPRALCDAVIELDDDRARLARMSQQCAALIRRDYSVERLSGDFAAVYRSLVAGAPVR
jgi:glycosyltransferase involved in cell wall biosynthesis